jgi:hypothetical protein
MSDHSADQETSDAAVAAMILGAVFLVVVLFLGADYIRSVLKVSGSEAQCVTHVVQRDGSVVDGHRNAGSSQCAS